MKQTSVETLTVLWPIYLQIHPLVSGHGQDKDAGCPEPLQLLRRYPARSLGGAPVHADGLGGDKQKVASIVYPYVNIVRNYLPK